MTTFKEEDYKGKLIEIGKYLSSLKKDELWMDENFRQIRMKAYKCFLNDGYLWKLPKKQKGSPLRVVCKKEEQQAQVIAEFHYSA